MWWKHSKEASNHEGCSSSRWRMDHGLRKVWQSLRCCRYHLQRHVQSFELAQNQSRRTSLDRAHSRAKQRRVWREACRLHDGSRRSQVQTSNNGCDRAATWEQLHNVQGSPSVVQNAIAGYYFPQRCQVQSLQGNQHSSLDQQQVRCRSLPDEVPRVSKQEAHYANWHWCLSLRSVVYCRLLRKYQ